MNTTANSNSLFPALGQSDYDRFAPLVRRNAIRIANRFPRLVTVSEHISVMDDYHQLVRHTMTPQTTSLDAAPVAQLGASTRGPDEVATVRLLMEKVAEAMRQLPERQQLLLDLMYQQGCSQKEAAEVLHVGAARVCQLHSDAIRRLQTQFSAA